MTTSPTHRTSALDLEVRSINLVYGEEGNAYNVTGRNALDIRFQVEQFRLNESLLLPITYGECWVHDGANILDKIEVKGLNNIQFQFGNPGSDKLVTKLFRIYNISDRKRVSNASQVYRIRFCSEELLLASQYPVVKSFKGKLISDIIKDICVNTMKIPQDRLTIEPTSGVVDQTMPWVRPFEAINRLARKALTASDHPSFVFYETLKEGFKFQSVETLFKGPTVAKYIYKQARIDSAVIDPYGIIAYKVRKAFDSISDIQSGKFASNLLTFDLLRLKADTVKFDSEEFFAKTQHLEDKSTAQSKTPLIKNRLGEAPNKAFEAHSRYVLTTLNQPKNAYIKSRMPNILPTQVEKTELQRNSFLQNFVDHRVRLTVPGNQSLQCGQVIEIEVISPELQNGESGVPQNERLLGGRYIVTTVSHYKTPTAQYYTDLTVVKDDIKGR
jgi:hypothetical protein